MIKRLFFIIVILILGFVVSFFIVSKPPRTQNPPPEKPHEVARQNDLKVKSSIPYWDQENAFASFSKNVQKHDYENLFWYYLTDDNAIAKYQYTNEDRNIISFAHNNNVKVFATITNLPEEGGWDSNRVEYMMRSANSRQKHISDILKILNELNFDGVNIDYEEVDASQKNKFTQFIHELSTALHADGKLLSISLHPKRAGSIGLGGFQDWKKLSDVADQMTIMSFNEHYDEGDAGPIASIPWVEKIIAYAQYLQVPGEKIYLGVPLFGYDWDHDNDEAAVGLTFSGVQSLINEHGIEPEWDSQAQSPYFTYENDGNDHEVWYEDEQSVKTKIDLAKRVGIAGISFWRLGGEDPAIWNEL